MFKLNFERMQQIETIVEKMLAVETVDPAPWQNPEMIEDISLFPTVNNSEALEFLFFVGALNFSYWIKQEGRVETWGVLTPSGQRVKDIFALTFCVSYAVETGELELTASSYEKFDRKSAEKMFAPVEKSCTIPMLESRIKKINELGEGLKRFGEDHGTTPSFRAFCREQESLEQFLEGLSDYFPYSFGDPFQKLSQLLFKIIVDRCPENMPESQLFPEEDGWSRSVNFGGIEKLTAQPDYMLPLFSLKTGLWDMEPTVKKYFSDQIELPMDHPVEVEIRRLTVETVAILADRVPGNSGLNAGKIDSIMWQRAVKGCFPRDCQGCKFIDWCAAKTTEPWRMKLDHHLTRTIYY